MCALCWQETVKYTQLQHTRARGIYIYIHSHAMETNENAKKTHRDDEEDSKEDFREKAGVYASSSAAQQQQQQQQQNQERTFTRVFDLADKYAQTRIAHEEKTREAMMSIARARYSLGAVGWEAVANDVEAKKTSAKCCVAKVTSSSSDDDDERDAFRAVFITDDDDEEEEKEGEEEDEQTTKRSNNKSFGRRRRQKPVYQARAVIEKFRELTKASAEVLSLKSALGREVERYKRQYLTAAAAAATAR